MTEKVVNNLFEGFKIIVNLSFSHISSSFFASRSLVLSWKKEEVEKCEEKSCGGSEAEYAYTEAICRSVKRKPLKADLCSRAFQLTCV